MFHKRERWNELAQESLRMFPAIALAERVAVLDTVIPLTESILTMAGEHIDHIPVRKGDVVFVGVASYQRFIISRIISSNVVTCVFKGRVPLG